MGYEYRLRGPKYSEVLCESVTEIIEPYTRIVSIYTLPNRFLDVTTIEELDDSAVAELQLDGFSVYAPNLSNRCWQYIPRRNGA